MNEDAVMSNIERATRTLGRVLAEVGWDGDESDEGHTFAVDLGPPHIPVSEVVLLIDPDTQSFMLLAHLEPAAPEGAREAVMRYITRVNWELTHGNFEMDLDEGAVRFRATVAFSGSELADTALRYAILCAMEAVEAHADALSALASGEARIEAIKPEAFFHG
jgi:hypothetical protein